MRELTSVADDEIVVCDGEQLRTHGGLEPDHEYEVDGIRARTLPRPPGERLATVTTVNDVHFGEVECGHPSTPVFRSDPGDPPYPETMNRAAIAEMAALSPDAVVVKGDLTAEGTVAEYEAFLDAYGVFGERLHHVRGNHDGYHGGTYAAFPMQQVELPGVVLAILDTTIPASESGTLSADQLEWLDELAARADRPVLVFGHHHPWQPGSASRPDTYFGLHPDASEALVDLAARRPAVAGYFAGHTHRNRVRRFAATGDRPWVEVACVKDFPGAWAEYRIFEGGILQIVRRVGSAAALRWTERTRAMFEGLYPGYAFGTLADRCLLIRTGFPQD